MTSGPDARLSAAETKEIVDRFYRDGFAVVRNVFTPEECAALRRRTDELAEDPAIRPPETKGGLFILRNPEQHDVAFVRLFLREPVLGLVQQILGPECRFSDQNVVRNETGFGISHWHVDDKLEYPLPPEIPRWDPRVRLPLMWLSIQAPLSDILTPENGPTEVVPGSHYSGRMPPKDNPVFEGRGAEPIYCRAGDVYLFNHQVWHRGKPNQSPTTRYLMQLQYSRGDSLAYRMRTLERTPALDRVLRGADPRLVEFMFAPPKYSAPGHHHNLNR